MSVYAFDIKNPEHATAADMACVIAEMAGRFWQFRCGPHAERGLAGPGFWAVFLDPSGPSDLIYCEHCDEPRLLYDDTSHGATLPEAVVIAARKAYDNDRQNIED